MWNLSIVAPKNASGLLFPLHSLGCKHRPVGLCLHIRVSSLSALSCASSRTSAVWHINIIDYLYINNVFARLDDAYTFPAPYSLCCFVLLTDHCASINDIGHFKMWLRYEHGKNVWTFLEYVYIYMYIYIYSRHFKVALCILQATYAAAMGCWQVDPKLDDREIFVTHLPPKAGTKDQWWNFLPCLLKMRYDFLRRTRIAAMTLQEGVRFLLGNFGDIDEEQSWRVEMLFQLKQENNLVFKRLQEDLCFVSTTFLYEVDIVNFAPWALSRVQISLCSRQCSFQD